MVDLHEHSSFGSRRSWSFREVARLTKERMKALYQGLIPVRLAGQSYSLSTLVAERQSIPSNILQAAETARQRLPMASVNVYGWEREALPAERRRRDPILVANTGGANYLLGFWLELATLNESAPEYIGFTMPWAAPRGRGRPSKGASLYGGI